MSTRLADVRLLAHLGEGPLGLLQFLGCGEDCLGLVEVGARDRVLGGAADIGQPGVRRLECRKPRSQTLPLRGLRLEELHEASLRRIRILVPEAEGKVLQGLTRCSGTCGVRRAIGAHSR